MFMHVDTLEAISQERRADLMREAMVLRLLKKENTAQSLPQRFRAFLGQLIRPSTAWQAQRAQRRETLSQHSAG